MRMKKMRTEVLVDGRSVELNDFVQEIIGRAVAGAVSALKGVEVDWKTIEVRISREERAGAEASSRQVGEEASA